MRHISKRTPRRLTRRHALQGALAASGLALVGCSTSGHRPEQRGRRAAGVAGRGSLAGAVPQGFGEDPGDLPLRGCQSGPLAVDALLLRMPGVGAHIERKLLRAGGPGRRLGAARSDELWLRGLHRRHACRDDHATRRQDAARDSRLRRRDLGRRRSGHGYPAPTRGDLRPASPVSSTGAGIWCQPEEVYLATRHRRTPTDEIPRAHTRNDTFTGRRSGIPTT